METIKKGSKGNAVKLLQIKLKLTPDGDFGAKTEEAVKKLQTDNGLTPDGIVGDKTWALITIAEKPSENSKEIPGCEYKPIDKHVTKCKRKITYLVIHFTAGCRSSRGAAMANRNAFLMREASADFVVDDLTCVQVNPDIENYYCWAVGDGKGKYGVTNKNSISIEICSTLANGASAKFPNHKGWSFSEAAMSNAVKLARTLVKRFGIQYENVIRHYDASRKSCPGLIGWNAGNVYDTDGHPIMVTDVSTGKRVVKRNTSEKWIEFKNRIVNV